mmetsp:Transcript_20566/g.33328  ORF Transcript_20566/g.33328 Transcript_20566/m.33328 type:complete len:87 (+) Transcript_20566:194-454(+)
MPKRRQRAKSEYATPTFCAVTDCLFRCSTLQKLLLLLLQYAYFFNPPSSTTTAFMNSPARDHDHSMRGHQRWTSEGLEKLHHQPAH